MSNTIDKRIKALASEQEYAHQYETKDRNSDYQYPDESKRIHYHVDSDVHNDKKTEELYDVDVYNVVPTETVDEGIGDNKIRVRNEKHTILEDHRQRSYKVKNLPQIWDKSDPGQEAYKLPNDVREDEIKYIKETSDKFETELEEEKQLDISKPNDRLHDDHMFTAGMKVQHNDEGINGVIKHMGSKIAIVWEDNTRERMSFDEAKISLKVLGYVGDVQEQVDPIHTEDFAKSKVVDKAVTAIEEEVVDSGDTDKINIENVKMQRKINELTAKVKQQDVEKIKEKAANEVIDLMQKKGMLSEDQSEVTAQFESIMKMDDAGFESFKQAVLGGNIKKASTLDDPLYSFLDEEEDFSDIEDGQEYAVQREAMKKQTKPTRSVDGIEMGDTSWFESGGLKNFKGNVGDFSHVAGSSNSSTSDVQPRNHKTIKKTASEVGNNGLDLSGFQNIQGIKTPINIPNKDLSQREKFSDLFSNIGWSGVPRR